MTRGERELMALLRLAEEDRREQFMLEQLAAARSDDERAVILRTQLSALHSQAREALARATAS